METECIFCSITNNIVKSKLIYEDENLISINDIKPQAPIHLLIIPKKHIRSINNLTNSDTELIANMIFLGKKLAKQKNIDKSGYKMLFNVGKGGGQIIFHLHLHLMGGW